MNLFFTAILKLPYVFTSVVMLDMKTGNAEIRPSYDQLSLFFTLVCRNPLSEQNIKSS